VIVARILYKEKANAYSVPTQIKIAQAGAYNGKKLQILQAPFMDYGIMLCTYHALCSA